MSNFSETKKYLMEIQNQYLKSSTNIIDANNRLDESLSLATKDLTQDFSKFEKENETAVRLVIYEINLLLDLKEKLEKL